MPLSTSVVPATIGMTNYQLSALYNVLVKPDDEALYTLKDNLNELETTLNELEKKIFQKNNKIAPPDSVSNFRHNVGLFRIPVHVSELVKETKGVKQFSTVNPVTALNLFDELKKRDLNSNKLISQYDLKLEWAQYKYLTKLFNNIILHMQKQTADKKTVDLFNKAIPSCIVALKKPNNRQNLIETSSIGKDLREKDPYIKRNRLVNFSRYCFYLALLFIVISAAIPPLAPFFACLAVVFGCLALLAIRETFRINTNGDFSKDLAGKSIQDISNTAKKINQKDCKDTIQYGEITDEYELREIQPQPPKKSATIIIG